MAKNFRLKERDTGVTIYPETTTEQVYAPDGRNLKALLPDLQRQIDAKLDTADLRPIPADTIINLWNSTE